MLSCLTGVVYGVDGNQVNIAEEICAPFDGANCPSLSGKPKVFIVQACQGGVYVIVQLSN